MEEGRVTNAIIEAGVAEAAGKVPGATFALTFFQKLLGESDKAKLDKAVAQADLEQQVAEEVRQEMREYVEELFASKHAAEVKQEYERTAPENRPSLADLFNFAKQLSAKAESSVDTKKRRLLAAAMINAFDPKLYQQGMNETLLAILDDITYADVTHLRKMAEDKTFDFKKINQINAEEIDVVDVQRLVDFGLVIDDSKKHSSYAAINYSISRQGRALIDLLREQ